MWRFANVRGKSIREKQNKEKGLTASLFKKLSHVTCMLTKKIFLKTYFTNGKKVNKSKIKKQYFYALSEKNMTSIFFHFGAPLIKTFQVWRFHNKQFKRLGDILTCLVSSRTPVFMYMYMKFKMVAK